MNEKEIAEKVGKAKEQSKKRKFAQTFDLAVNLKNYDLKKPENKFSEVVVLPSGRGKKRKICALIDKDLLPEVGACDFSILKEKFGDFAKDPKKIKKLARAYDIFIAQATIMPDVAKTFGKYLAPLGKMPDPKMGCVVPPKAKLAPLVEKLNKVVVVSVKKQPVIHISIGVESMAEVDVAKNAMAVVDAVKKKLLLGDSQIKSVFLKLTMGKPVRLV